MHEPDLALNNLEWLICYKPKPNQKFHDTPLFKLYLIYCHFE